VDTGSARDAEARQNVQRTRSLRTRSPEDRERRRLAAIAEWPRGDSGEARNPAGEPLKARFGSDTETVRTARKSLTPFAERMRRMALTRVDWHIFGPLVGSLPGILLGSYLSARVSELALRITLCG